MSVIRLDKFLSEMSIGTRSEVKKIIRSGRIDVNGKTVLKPEQKVDTDKDIVELDGESVNFCEFEYYMLNKPQGYVSATKDKEYKTVLELVKEKSRTDLFPVGRLDIDTEGLLLITNDGELAHKLLAPNKHVDKTYFVIVRGKVGKEDIEKLTSGIDIGDEEITKPALVEDIQERTWEELTEYHGKMNKKYVGEDASEITWTTLKLTIHEGRYHQIKRMMYAVGCPVVYLKRIRMGNLILDENLAVGGYKKLDKSDIIL